VTRQKKAFQKAETHPGETVHSGSTASNALVGLIVQGKMAKLLAMDGLTYGALITSVYKYQ
jgi:hypothetical protein